MDLGDIHQIQAVVSVGQVPQRANPLKRGTKVAVRMKSKKRKKVERRRNLAKRWRRRTKEKMGKAGKWRERKGIKRTKERWIKLKVEVCASKDSPSQKE